MAFNLGGSNGRGRRYGGGTLSEMNVVPLVDVVLVLLIIFMITAQAMEFGLEIEVPKVKQEKASSEDLPVVSVTRTGEIYLADKPVNIHELAGKVRAQYGKNGKAVYVRADKATSWDTAVQVIDVLGRAKIDVRIVTTTQEDTRRRR